MKEPVYSTVQKNRLWDRNIDDFSAENLVHLLKFINSYKTTLKNIKILIKLEFVEKQYFGSFITFQYWKSHAQFWKSQNGF